MSAQRYKDATALARMAEGRCPECNHLPGAHSNDPRFWIPGHQDCSLTQAGVDDRIDQYKADLQSVIAETLNGS